MTPPRHARQGLQKRGAAPWIRKLLPGARPQPDSTRFPCTVVAHFRSRIDDDKPASPLHATCADPTHRFARRGVNSSLCPRAQLRPVLSPLCEACPVHRVPTLIILSCVPPLVRASRRTSFVPQEPLVYSERCLLRRADLDRFTLILASLHTHTSPS